LSAGAGKPEGVFWYRAMSTIEDHLAYGLHTDPAKLDARSECRAGIDEELGIVRVVRPVEGFQAEGHMNQTHGVIVIQQKYPEHTAVIRVLADSLAGN
jgi:hypothetical protein